MKTINITKMLLLFWITFSLQTQAQSYTPPSQERVETLLKKVDNCKKAISQGEGRIKVMEKNPESYTLAQYNLVKGFIESSKVCLNKLRTELAELRKDYPGWFNAPNATVALDREHFTSPKKLREALDEIKERIDAVLKSFEGFDEPKK